MALVLNLEKSAETLKLCLEKAGIVTPPELEVGIGMDVSGSFEDEHRAGITNALMTRFIPWSMVFDPDKKIDLLTFADGAGRVTDVGPVTPDNYVDFIPRNVIGKVNGWNCGTEYSHLVERMLVKFGWQKPAVKAAPAPAPAATPAQKPGFLARLFGASTPVAAPAAPAPVVATPEPEAEGEGPRKALVLIITDGENSDERRTREVHQASQNRGDGVYFMYIGVSNQGTTFPHLERLANEFSNVGYVAIKNLRQFINLSDEELNERIISDELLEWFKA
ncbi:VWA domain-containing protein [Burkholderia multivorans]|uniref:VWA domain-containing protein n=1 Tax=Burkholderia multivorans TaxID=87883 RepID=UPI001C21C5C7|nr:VWA domain-containing protein [Burkholderia multivorans]MBU9200261.1 VWA domain-containing protein [Burkholderia multivorans]MDN8078612.1 VWA domain-containing protein [Burkholderia multivorans]